MQWLKTHPAAIYAIIVTGFGTFNSEALANHLLSGKTLSWIDLVFAVITAAGGVAVHGSVTPLADPKLDSHTPLVPATDVQAVPVPASTGFEGATVPMGTATPIQ